MNRTTVLLRKRLASFLVVCSLASVGVSAQTEGVDLQMADVIELFPQLPPGRQESRSLTLGNAWRLAILNHPALAARRSTIGAAIYDVKAAEWKRYPTVSMELAQVSSSQTGNANTFRAQQPLWTGGRITAEIDQSQARQTIAEMALIETEQDLLTRIVQAYTDYQRLSQRVEVAKANVAEHERLHGLIARRSDQEVSSPIDVALAFSRMQQARTELTTLEATRANARSSLEQLIGQPIGELAPVEPMGWSWKNTQDVQASAERFSPSLRRLEAEVALAEAEVAGRKAAIMPQLSARYEKAAGNSHTIVRDERWLLALEYQPGAGFSSFASAAAAGKRSEAAKSSVEAGWRDLAEKVSAQFNEANSFANQLRPTRDYAEAARSVTSSYLRQYVVGRKSWQEVMNAQRETAQAGYTLADVEAGVRLSSIKLHILTGGVTGAAVLAE